MNCSSTSYSYDSLENITSKTENIGSMTKTVGYGYDTSNQMTSITYPSGLVVNYTYTKGQVSSLDLSGTLTANVLHQITYRPFSQVMTGGVWGNAQTFSNSYDQNEKLTALQDSNKINLTFTMDGVGNITQAVDNLDSTKTFYAGYNYDYGLTSFVQNGSGTNYSGTPSGNYNRNSMSSNGNSTSYNYVSNSNILASYSINSGAGITVTTDANGNITADGTSASYSYDLKNNLTGFNGTASYALNALNQRVSKTVNGVTNYFVYDENSNLLGEYDSSGNPIIEHIYMNGMPVATVKAGVLYYVHTDQLGTPRVITDTSNNTVWHWDNMDAFGGNLPTENGLSGYNLRFSGQYFDNESNLSYNNNRTYNPKLGRYMQVDPIGLAGGNNPFNYAGSNPVNFSDFLAFDPKNTFVMASMNNPDPSYQRQYGLRLNNTDDPHTLSFISHGGPQGIVFDLDSQFAQTLDYSNAEVIKIINQIKNMQTVDKSSVLINFRAFATLIKHSSIDLNNYNRIIIYGCNYGSGNATEPHGLADILKKPVSTSTKFVVLNQYTSDYRTAYIEGWSDVANKDMTVDKEYIHPRDDAKTFITVYPH